jgi:hypothetical protein
MVGDLLLAFIVLCMAILVGYPMFKLLVSRLQEKRSRR